MAVVVLRKTYIINPQMYLPPELIAIILQSVVTPRTKPLASHDHGDSDLKNESGSEYTDDSDSDHQEDEDQCTEDDQDQEPDSDRGDDDDDEHDESDSHSASEEESDD